MLLLMFIAGVDVDVDVDVYSNVDVANKIFSVCGLLLVSRLCRRGHHQHASPHFLFVQIRMKDRFNF